MTGNITNLVTNTISVFDQQTVALPRLGLINYINSLPFVLPIVDGKITVGADIFFGEPTQLNALYAVSHLDLGAMSAFSFLQQKTLKLMPGISISSQNAVGSVLFFVKPEVKMQKQLRISVPMASASALNLLLVLLLEHGYGMPVLIPSPKPDLSKSDIDAALIIGDEALIIAESWSELYKCIDLGLWWRQTYSLPAVFGVFAAREQWYENNSHIFKTINESLKESAQYGLSGYFDKILAQSAEVTGLSKIRLTKYFKEELEYSLESDHLNSLDTYATLCRKYGLLR